MDSQENRQPKILVREPVEQDLPNLTSMIAALSAYHDDQASITEADLSSFLFGDDPWIEILIAEVENKVVGYTALHRIIQLHAGMRGMVIHHLFVDEEYRGLGIASELVDASISVARDNGCGYIRVTSDIDNEAAQNFYISKDFVISKNKAVRFNFLLE